MIVLIGSDGSVYVIEIFTIAKYFMIAFQVVQKIQLLSFAEFEFSTFPF